MGSVDGVTDRLVLSELPELPEVEDCERGPAEEQGDLADPSSVSVFPAKVQRNIHELETERFGFKGIDARLVERIDHGLNPPQFHNSGKFLRARVATQRAR